MARQAKHRSNAPVLRKLKKTLQILEETSSEVSFLEAKQYICPVCDLAVKPCEVDSRATCFHMLREGTELQSLSDIDREGLRRCLSCGKTISRKTLAKYPTSELCAACTKKSSRTRTAPLPKGTST